MDIKKDLLQDMQPVFELKNDNIQLHELQQDQLLDHAAMESELTKSIGESQTLFRKQAADMHDSPQMGGGSSKARKEAQKNWNEDVKAKTGKTINKATVYTSTLAGKIGQVIQKEVEEKPDTENNIATMQYYEKNVDKLINYPYSPQMFIPSMIQKNFGEYLKMVREYDEVYKERLKLANNHAIHYSIMNEFNNLKPLMDMLKNRLEVFATENRVTLQGEIMKDSEKSEKLLPNAVEQWCEGVKEWTGKHQDFLAEEYSLKIKMDTNELKEKWSNPDAQTEIDVEEMSITQRVTHLPLIQKNYLEAKQQRQQAEAGEASPEQIVALKHQEQLCQAYYILAHAEAEYVLENSRKVEKPNVKLLTEYSEKALEAYKDVQRLKRRNMLEEAGRLSEIKTSMVVERTREEATNTHSDQKSKQSRKELERLINQYSGNESVVSAVRSYLAGDRYTVGYSEETARLKKAMTEVEKAVKKDNSPELAEIQQYFKRMTNGILALPAERVTNSEVAFLNCTKKQPQETGKTLKGGRRNSIIRFFSKWKNKKDTPLFSHEPTVNDLKQRMVSNCYMMAATAGMVELSPKLIKDSIVDNGNGTVTVRLYEQMTDSEYEKFLKRFGQQLPKEQSDDLDDMEELSMEESVSQTMQNADTDNELDDFDLDDIEDISTVMEVSKQRTLYVTVSKETPQLFGGVDSLSAGALWMQMIEKACAFVGRNAVGGRATGYQSLWYGNGDEFVARLTGKAAEHHLVNANSSQEEKDRLFRQICNCHQNKMVFNAGSNPDNTAEDGLNAGHAYTVLGGKVQDGKQYVLLRNPYSTYSLKYKGEGDGQSKIRTSGGAVTSSDATYGQFYIEYNEFLQKFSNISSTDLSSSIT